MAEAAREVLVTYRALLDQMDKDALAHPEDPPFSIQDWGASAERIDHMSTSLQGLLAKISSEGGSPELKKLGEMTESSAQRIIDYALWRALAFLTLGVLIIAGTGLGTVLIYRRIFPSHAR